MRIVNLIAENIKKLTAIDITPKDSIVYITGPNGAGKSSVLDSIVMALCGGKAIPEVPIKKGADKGKIVIEMEEFTVTRSFTKENSYLKIENKDGSAVGSPQKFLDRIVGNISFDPLDFLNNEKKKQRDILLQLLGVNVNELDKNEKFYREERTIAGRYRDKAEALYKSIEYFPQIKDNVTTSISELSAELGAAVNHNTAIQEATQGNELEREKAKGMIKRMEEIALQIESLTIEKGVLEEGISNIKTKYLAVKERIAQTPAIDIVPIQARFKDVEEHNRMVQKNIERKKAQADYDLSNEKYQEFTKKIEDIAAERISLLAGAKMPVEGLSFDDGGLLYNGIPLDQASDGEKLMVSLGISMALNPTMRVLRIKDGSLLDEANRAIISTMVADKDYQLWFESVGSDTNVGILIEEGEIKKVDGVVQASKAKSRKKATEEPKTEQPKAEQPTAVASPESWPDITASTGAPEEPTKPEPTKPEPTNPPVVDWP